MDNNITVRFSRIEPENNRAQEFGEKLLEIAEIPVGDREYNVGPAVGQRVIARLERARLDGEFIVGEFIRRQVDNKPPEASADGLAPLNLADGSGLGHSSAFRFHVPTSVLALQYNPSGVSEKRISTYLKAVDAVCDYSINRIPTEDALERFRAGHPRAFEIEIASPANVPSVEGTLEEEEAERTVVGATRMLGEVFQGMSVTVSVSMGRHEGELPKGPIESVINRLLFWKRDGEIDLRKLRIKSKTDDEVEFISFLNEFLQEKTTLDLPDDDVDRNYTVRENQIATWFDLHLPYLRRIFLE